MNLVLNDMVFLTKIIDYYQFENTIKEFVDVIIELEKCRKTLAVIFDKDISLVEIMSDYPFSKLYNDRNVQVDQRRVIMRLFTKIKKVDLSDYETIIRIDNDESKLCGYAVDNGMVIISLTTDNKFVKPILDGIVKNSGESVKIHNISQKAHVYVHTSILKIRVYEMNPKHKIGSNWGSPMDLCDETAQKVLDDAMTYDDDDKHLINYYNGKYYVFRRHINNCYHGYIDENVPLNIRKKLADFKNEV